MQINIQKSDSSLSQLVARAIAGEEVIIESEAGDPIARLVPYEKKQNTPRTLGGWEGKVWIADDFDDIPEEIVEAFGINDK